MARDGNGSYSDEKLILLSIRGNRNAFEELTCRHREWIYKRALSMVRDPQAAEDASQDVMLILLTRLSTFRGESSFRCWLQRIVTNHVINTVKRKSREMSTCFSQYGSMWNNMSLVDLPDPHSIPVDLHLIMEEACTYYMMGIMHCLLPEQRMIFILGDLFEVNDCVGSEVFRISRVNYRKKLSRARKRVYGFVRENYIAANNGRLKKRNGLSNDLPRIDVKPGSKRIWFQQKYLRLSEYLHDRFKRLSEECASVNSAGLVRYYQEILSCRELRGILEVG